NVSRFSIYQWQRKVAKAALGNGDAPTCGPTPTDIEAQRDAEILGEWKRHPGLEPSSSSFAHNIPTSSPTPSPKRSESPPRRCASGFAPVRTQVRPTPLKRRHRLRKHSRRATTYT